LDFLGIPWNLSTEISLFNGLRPTSRRFYFHVAHPLRKMANIPFGDGVDPLEL
jgi:hypothetical protein